MELSGKEPNSATRPETLLPRSGIELLRQGMADEAIAAKRTLYVALTITTIGPIAPLVLLLLGYGSGALGLMSCLAISCAACALGLIVLKLHRSSQLQRRRLLSKCLDIEQSSTMAQIAIGTGRYRLAAEIVMSAGAAKARRQERRRRLAKRAIQLANARRNSAAASSGAEGGAAVLQIEAARKRRRKLQQEVRAKE